jgi:molybdopterin-guanine dinucleotide biosynthesis protein A
MNVPTGKRGSIDAVIGAVLAGGAGRRMGGDKAAAVLAGRPLAAYAVDVLAQVCERVAVVCKPGTALPSIDGAERWEEPEDPQHPVAGIAYALERAGGPVLVCAGDMPFVTADACRSLIEAASGAGAVDAAVAIAAGVLQPVLGLYAPTALDALRAAPDDAPLTETVAALEPVRVALPPRLVRSVNTPEDLAEAEAELASPRSAA